MTGITDTVYRTPQPVKRKYYLSVPTATREPYTSEVVTKADNTQEGASAPLLRRPLAQALIDGPVQVSGTRAAPAAPTVTCSTGVVHYRCTSHVSHALA